MSSEAQVLTPTAPGASEGQSTSASTSCPQCPKSSALGSSGPLCSVSLSSEPPIQPTFHRGPFLICFFFFFTKVYFYSIKLCLYVLCRFSFVLLCATLWTVAHQAPLSLGFSRQEHWSGLPCPPPGDLPHPGIEPASPASPALQADSSLSHQGTQSCSHKGLKD